MKRAPSLPALKKRVQRKVNAYIRLRDRENPCISCGKTTSLRWEAGHFWTQGAHGALRYDLDNIHKQCSACNRWKSGNLNEYRLRLIHKIGAELVQRLDDLCHERKAWTREELIQIEEHIAHLTKGLKEGGSLY